MIIGIGIDSAEINRFAQWHSYSDAQLSRIFSAEEIAYCRANPLKSAERCAVRFAAREAFFKALSTALPDHHIPFLRLCKAVSIAKDLRGKPELVINWQSITQANMQFCVAWISCTHTKTTATAMVLLEKKETRE